MAIQWQLEEKERLANYEAQKAAMLQRKKQMDAQIEIARLELELDSARKKYGIAAPAGPAAGGRAAAPGSLKKALN
jgi:hypothetical protein